MTQSFSEIRTADSKTGRINRLVPEQFCPRLPVLDQLKGSGGFQLIQVCLLLSGLWSRPYEAQHVDGGLQEELEDGGSRGGAELCGSPAVSLR